MVVVLLGVAVLRATSPVGHPPQAWFWLAQASMFAVWAYGMIVMFRGMLQMKAMGSDLRPAGSWKTPFGRGSCFGTGRAFGNWFATWFGGILAFIAYSLCRHGLSEEM